MPDEPIRHPAPDFDGHLERPLLSLSPAERLDWIWACMELLWAGQSARAKEAELDLTEASVDVTNNVAADNERVQPAATQSTRGR